MINIFAILKRNKEIDEILLLFKQIILSLFLYSIHMVDIQPNALSFNVSKDLSKGQPIFFIQFPHVLHIELLNNLILCKHPSKCFSKEVRSFTIQCRICYPWLNILHICVQGKSTRVFVAHSLCACL